MQIPGPHLTPADPEEVCAMPDVSQQAPLDDFYAQPRLRIAGLKGANGSIL